MSEHLSGAAGNEEDQSPTKWDSLADYEQAVSEVKFPEELEGLEVMARDHSVESFQVFLRNPPERMSGLSDEDWHAVQAHVDNAENWAPYRRELHEKVIDRSLADCDAMSRRLRQKEIERGDPATIYVLRGTCGAGKTTALRSGDRFPGVLDENGQPTGSVAPDVLKAPLRRQGTPDGEAPRISHAQIHQESGVLNRRLMSELRKRAIEGRDSGEGYSMVVDKLMSTQHDIEGVLEDAAETERDVRIIDVDVPFELSAVRVLCRTAEGDDPQIPFDGVAIAFKNIRTERRALVQSACMGDKSRIRSYELVVFNPATKRQETIMRTESGVPEKMTHEQAVLAIRTMATTEKTNDEIEELRNTVITDEFIEEFISKYFDQNDEKSMRYARATRDVLMQFKGMTMEEAMDVRAGKRKREEILTEQRLAA